MIRGMFTFLANLENWFNFNKLIRYKIYLSHPKLCMKFRYMCTFQEKNNGV